jgi:hypothetical protein
VRGPELRFLFSLLGDGCVSAREYFSVIFNDIPVMYMLFSGFLCRDIGDVFLLC